MMILFFIFFILTFIWLVWLIGYPIYKKIKEDINVFYDCDYMSKYALVVAVLGVMINLCGAIIRLII